jgi:hypothetical protein
MMGANIIYCGRKMRGMEVSGDVASAPGKDILTLATHDCDI